MIALTTSSSFLPPLILQTQQVSIEISMTWTNDASKRNSSGPSLYYPWRPPWRVDQSRHPLIFHFGIPLTKYCDGGLIYCWPSCNPQCPFVYFPPCWYRQFLQWQKCGMYQWFGPCPATWQSLLIFSLMTILPPFPLESPPCLLLGVSTVVSPYPYLACHPSSPPALMTFPPYRHPSIDGRTSGSHPPSSYPKTYSTLLTFPTCPSYYSYSTCASH
mmetsp:Transcript_23899/g.34152  ORF Transcript_23899/g.34152 Transcript_23899/m.34152 type:complete len:216 (-) Transcript_23899:50-697(-)